MHALSAGQHAVTSIGKQASVAGSPVIPIDEDKLIVTVRTNVPVKDLQSALDESQGNV